MAQVSPAELVFQTTASTLQEKRKLRRHFRRFDIFFYLICTVVTLDTVGAIASIAAIEEFFGTVGGPWKYVYAVAFFAATVIAYAAMHGVHGFGGHAFLPSYALFIAVVPVLIFNYAGLEVPSAAGEEMTNPQRDVPFSVLWSGGATMLAYGIPILLILMRR